MSSMQKNRLISVMKKTTEVLLLLLALSFILSMISDTVKFFVTGEPSYMNEGYKNLSISFKILFNLLATGKIAILGFIIFQLRKILINFTVQHPFEQDNVRRVRLIGKSIVLLTIFPIIRVYAVNSQSSILFVKYLDMFYVLFSVLQTVFIGIIVFVVAEVYRRGVVLYQEQKLTV
ncbi:MAG: DUF2975 domain-containing protein [Candidatus Latescibacteria bacterium]|nr:DUF2975 domain-containing protein [Candidatus Latescibacterota bacterium]